MKKGSTYFLKGVIGLLGLGVLALCIFVLPIGLRGDATGYYQPIIIGMYVAAIPFFVALYQAFTLLGYIERSMAFTAEATKTLRVIRNCALAISGLFTAGMPYIFYAGDRDDAPGVIALALVIIFASFVIATFAAVLKKLIQNAVEIKSENDLTV